MPSYTDRELRKFQEATQLAGTSASNVTDAVARMNVRPRDFAKVGTENAATNVAETVMYSVRNKSRPARISYLTGTNSAQDATNYLVFTISKRTAGASKTTIATYNTHNSAQGSIVANVSAAFSIVPNSDAIIAAGDTLSYEVTKQGSGVALAIGTITVDNEEI